MSYRSATEKRDAPWAIINRGGHFVALHHYCASDLMQIYDFF